MKGRITRAEAKAFKTRWKAANSAEKEELRTTSAAKKLRQLAALTSSTASLGWTEALASEEAEVRNRWNRLRRAYGV